MCCTGSLFTKTCLLKKLEERTFDALTYVQFFFCKGPSDIWWGLVLYAEMNDLIEKCLLCPWSSACLIGLYRGVMLVHMVKQNYLEQRYETH